MAEGDGSTAQGASDDVFHDAEEDVFPDAQEDEFYDAQEDAWELPDRSEDAVSIHGKSDVVAGHGLVSVRGSSSSAETRRPGVDAQTMRGSARVTGDPTGSVAQVEEPVAVGPEVGGDEARTRRRPAISEGKRVGTLEVEEESTTQGDTE